MKIMEEFPNKFSLLDNRENKIKRMYSTFQDNHHENHGRIPQFLGFEVGIQILNQRNSIRLCTPGQDSHHENHRRFPQRSFFVGQQGEQDQAHVFHLSGQSS
jgi:hypothetical protein